MIRAIYKKIMTAVCTVSPVAASHILYLRNMKRFMNLRNPQTFSEKLMRLKLENYINNEAVWRCADKYTVREYVKTKGVKELNLPKILGSYGDANDIDFDSLPNKFALKCTHGAGFNIICTDKSQLDRASTINQLNQWLDTRFGLETAETHYGKVTPRIICEAFIESNGDDLPNDYKVYCFNGVPTYIMACTERKIVSKVNIMDLDWKDTGYIQAKYSSRDKIVKPSTLAGMLEISKKISGEFPFVRVDFYEEDNVPILGEMTFTPHGCVNSNMTKDGQSTMGKLLN